MEKVLISVLLYLLLSQIGNVESACSEVKPTQYEVTGYSGGVPDSHNCRSLMINNQETTVCGEGTVLRDGNTGPTADSVDLTSASVMNDFLKWQTMGSIEFSFGSNSSITRIVLHFLNYPNENIGLPNFQLSIDTEDADFSISGQSELSTDDRRVRSVTLNVLPSATRTGTDITLDISFDGLSNAEQFYLSEVSIFEARAPITFQQPPSDNTVVNPFPTTPTEITLNCTVSEMGQFEWQWKKGEQIVSNSERRVIIESTRVTTLTIFNLHFSDAGMYTCEVRRNGESLDTFCDSISQQLILQASIESPDSVTEPSANLTCELSGYLNDGSDAVWFKEGDNNPLQKDTKYTVTTINGSQLTQSSDGESTHSVVSVLTINMLETGDSGRYICRDPSSGIESNTTLSVITGDSCSSMTNTAIIAAVVSVSALTLALSAVVHFIICVVQMKHKRNQQSSMNTDTVDEIPNGMTASLPLSVTEGHKDGVEVKMNECYEAHKL